MRAYELMARLTRPFGTCTVCCVCRSRRPSGVDAKWRLHDLRHWSASAAISVGHDVKTVADRLGHANAAMTLQVDAMRSRSQTVRLLIPSA